MLDLNVEVHGQNLEKIFDIIQDDTNFIPSGISPDFRIHWKNIGGYKNYETPEVMPNDWFVIYISYRASDFQIHPNSPLTTIARLIVPFAIRTKNVTQQVTTSVLVADHNHFMQTHHYILENNAHHLVQSYIAREVRTYEVNRNHEVIGYHLIDTDSVPNISSDCLLDYAWLDDGSLYNTSDFDTPGKSNIANFVDGTYNMSLIELIDYQFNK